MMTLDYTFDRQIALERRDSRAEGRAEGRVEGHAEGHAEGLTEGEMLGIIKSCKRLGETREDTADYLRIELGLTKNEAMERVEENW